MVNSVFFIADPVLPKKIATGTEALLDDGNGSRWEKIQIALFFLSIKKSKIIQHMNKMKRLSDPVYGRVFKVLDWGDPGSSPSPPLAWKLTLDLSLTLRRMWIELR